MFVPELPKDLSVKCILLSSLSTGRASEYALLNVVKQVKAQKLGYYQSEFQEQSCRADAEGKLLMPAEVWYFKDTLFVCIRSGPRHVEY
jgi:hypothetical protein